MRTVASADNKFQWNIWMLVEHTNTRDEEKEVNSCLAMPKEMECLLCFWTVIVQLSVTTLELMSAYVLHHNFIVLYCTDLLFESCRCQCWTNFSPHSAHSFFTHECCTLLINSRTDLTCLATKASYMQTGQKLDISRSVEERGTGIHR
jgi:hypothetical protein